jgi:hypothetical protein
LAAIECLAADLAGARSHDYHIKGSVVIWLLNCNPYVSFSHVAFTDGSPDLLRVGWLLFQQLGARGPAIRVPPDDTDAWQAFHTHQGNLAEKRDFLFSWSGSQVEFRKDFAKPGGYNVFVSYNRDDEAAVTALGEELYRRGIARWQDDRAIAAGQEWLWAIEAAIVRCPASLVFFGPRGLGYWQVREIERLLDRARENHGFQIIPVVLPGGVVPPDLQAQIVRFNMVHLRTLNSGEQIDWIAQAIRKANGLG